MSIDEIERFLSPLEIENAELLKANQELTKENENLRSVLKRVEAYMHSKECGFNGAMRMYVSSVIDGVRKMLEKEGIVKQNEENIDTKGKKH